MEPGDRPDPHPLDYATPGPRPSPWQTLGEWVVRIYFGFWLAVALAVAYGAAGLLADGGVKLARRGLP